jgi:competence protein ComFC
MNFKEFLLNILFPRTCAGCKKSLDSGVICDSCFKTIPRNSTFFCATCDARLPDGRKTCHREAPCVIGGAGPYYNPALRNLVHQLKFKGVREASIPLANLIAAYLRNAHVTCRMSHVAFLVPIPLSKRRERERGYNQAGEIARQLGVIMNIPLDENLLTRQKHTKPQTETHGIEERLKNIEGCFRAANGVSGKNIVLIDDVATSGATFREAARALKMAGAKKIVAVAAAKA